MLQAQSADPILLVCYEPHRQKPQLQRLARVLKHRASGQQSFRLARPAYEHTPHCHCHSRLLNTATPVAKQTRLANAGVERSRGNPPPFETNHPSPGTCEGNLCRESGLYFLLLESITWVKGIPN